MSQHDPEVVRNEYATEKRFLRRRAAFAASTGPSAVDVLFEAVAEVEPRRVLEVGCGPGDMAERILRETGAELVAVDISPRMVELACGLGVDARVGDVRELPFDDGAFDCAVAGWMLYHVPDLDLALAELARVLRPGGRLVAATNSIRNLGELWDLVGRDRSREGTTFLAEDGEERLRRHFAAVERRDVVGELTFTREQAVDYLENSIGHAHLVERLPALEEPLHATRRMTVFVATR